jgi:hypothetical protein
MQAIYAAARSTVGNSTANSVGERHPGATQEPVFAPNSFGTLTMTIGTMPKSLRPIGRHYRQEAGIRNLLRYLVLGAAAFVNSPALAQSSSAPLLYKQNLTYVGAFRVPDGGDDTSTLNFGGRALSYNAANNSLFITGHDHHQTSAEISIPALVNSSNLSDLNTATYLQTHRDATEGRLSQVNPSDDNGQKVGGHLVYGGKLYVTGYSTYDGAGTQSGSHFVRPVSLSTSGQVQGPYRVGSDAHYTSAYMALVPPEWQAALGGPALSGNCCQSIIGNHSRGPAVSVFNPSDVGQTSSISATRLVHYTSDNGLGPGVSTQNPYFNLTTRVEGVVLPNGTRSVLFFGSHGIGPYCYGEGDACGDPTKSEKGTHAYPYVFQVWAYDANDLAEVKSGTKQPHEVQPYDVWTFNLPFEKNDGHLLGGATFDPSTGRIYVSQPRADAKLPVIYAFEINTGPRPNAPGSLLAQ